MKSVQESKNELEAAIRYAENAISSAKQTIESMEFRQEMAKKQHDEQTGREEALTKQVQELEERNDGLNAQVADLNVELQRQQGLGQGYYDTMMTFKAEVEKLRKEKEASSGPCGCQAYRDLEEKVGDLKDDLKDQREFDNEVRDAVEEFIEKLGTIGFEGA
jgi:chromosome segregation ATPase